MTVHRDPPPLSASRSTPPGQAGCRLDTRHRHVVIRPFSGGGRRLPGGESLCNPSSTAGVDRSPTSKESPCEPSSTPRRHPPPSAGWRPRCLDARPPPHQPPRRPAATSTRSTSDYNGDGYDDAAVGDPYATVNGQARAGAVTMLLGDADGRIGDGDRRPSPRPTSVTPRRPATGSASMSPWAGPLPAAPACWSAHPARTWTVSRTPGWPT